MQPELSGKSQLFNSLKSYLNNKSRLQPIIGLCRIIECVNVSSDNRETLYLCEVCLCRVTKADIRNHILGSHHRFNYIKTCHPHLACKWQENSDLAKLAWPLMELAKILERREGPGDVQLFEVPDAVYQKIATESVNHAVILINTLRDGGGELESLSEILSLHYPVESQRVVLRAQKSEDPETFDNTDTKPYKMWAQTEHPRLTPAHKTSTSQLEDTQTLPDNNSSFVEGYSEATPLIGLVCVVEFRSESGSSQCFLCHCCRIKSNTQDIADHLTSSSHQFNYLMETYPDLVKGMSKDTEAHFHLLRSLASRVEQQDGRGEMMIVNVPESFCNQLTGKSYHWCLRMQLNGWVTDIQEKREADKGVIKTAMPKKNTVRMLKQENRETLRRRKKKKKKNSNTMFSVSLPFREGAMLLERTSFNKDNLLELTSLPLSDSGPVSSPAESNLNCDTTPLEMHRDGHLSELETSQSGQGLYQGDVDYGEDIAEEHIKITVFQDTSDHVNQPTERKYDGQHGSQERSGYNTYTDRQNEGLQAQSQGLFPAVSHSKDWSDSYYRQGEDDPDRWYNSASTRVEESRQEMGNKNTYSVAVQRYQQQQQHQNQHQQQHQQQHQHQQQQMGWADAGPHTGSMWGNHDLSSEVVSFVEAARTNMHTHSEDAPVHSGNVLSHHRAHFHETEPRQLQTYTELNVNQYQMAPQSYTAQSATCQMSQMDQRWMFYSNHHAGYCTNPVQHPADPVSSSSGAAGWGSMHPNAFIQPGQAVIYGAGSDVYFRAGVPN